MAEEKGATPPNGGRTDHDVMRRVAGRSEDAPGDKTEERIPGERDAETAMHSEPGIIAGTGYGENIPTGQPDTMDERTHRERKREGGGDPGQRDKSKGGLHG